MTRPLFDALIQQGISVISKCINVFVTALVVLSRCLAKPQLSASKVHAMTPKTSMTTSKKHKKEHKGGCYFDMFDGVLMERTMLFLGSKDLVAWMRAYMTDQLLRGHGKLVVAGRVCAQMTTDCVDLLEAGILDLLLPLEFAKGIDSTNTTIVMTILLRITTSSMPFVATSDVTHFVLRVLRELFSVTNRHAISSGQTRAGQIMASLGCRAIATLALQQTKGIITDTEFIAMLQYTNTSLQLFGMEEEATEAACFAFAVLTASAGFGNVSYDTMEIDLRRVVILLHRFSYNAQIAVWASGCVYNLLLPSNAKHLELFMGVDLFLRYSLEVITGAMYRFRTQRELQLHGLAIMQYMSSWCNDAIMIFGTEHILHAIFRAMNYYPDDLVVQFSSIAIIANCDGRFVLVRGSSYLVRCLDSIVLSMRRYVLDPEFQLLSCRAIDSCLAAMNESGDYSAFELNHVVALCTVVEAAAQTHSTDFGLLVFTRQTLVLLNKII